MAQRLRPVTIAVLAILVAVGALLASGGLGNVIVAPGASPPTGASGGAPGSPGASIDVVPTTPPTPTPRPAIGGTELYGYLPYWQMNEAVATHLRSAPLTTLALFSVAARANGSLSTGTTAYRRITGAIGRRLIDEAHARDARVDLVFTSFGAAKNAAFLGRVLPPASPPVPAQTLVPGTTTAPVETLAPAPTPAAVPTPVPTPGPPPWQRAVGELVALAQDLGVDGINVDVELLEAEDRLAYGEFLAALRAALVAAIPGAQLSVATEAGQRGTGNAAVAAAAGVDRLFLMGYDYHWAGSGAGASSPVDRTDGLYTLRWSIDSYVDAGVPRDRILLGLPLYGMQWRVEGPHRIYPVIGKGVTWIPGQHRDLLLDRGFQAARDDLELAEWFAVPDGEDWLLTYFDSPRTLRPKLALALDHGLAGAGFWAMGYERGLPGYLELMQAFRDGEITRDEAPARR
jgi:hypothetical protein